MKRYVTLDILRGLAIFGMTFLHLLDDLYNYQWAMNDASLQAAPLISVLTLIVVIYLGSWAGLFLMVSAVGNMISMQKNAEKGIRIGNIILKQVIGGFILLFFGFLAEGTLQYYALFQTLRAGNPDFTRIIWKSYTMETIHAIAWCMIINGIIQGILMINKGHKKITRNMYIYAILAIIVVALTQTVWDWVKFTVISGYPFDPMSTGRDLQYPSVGATFGEYILKFIMLPLAGQPEPIFPFLAVSFIGSIVGLALSRDEVSHEFPKKGILAGFIIFLFGLLFGIIADLPLDSFLPLSDFSTFTRIGEGLNYRWVPWIFFITGGQLVVVCMMFRLIEFRGKSKETARNSKFIRRFGMIPFTIYTFHRILAMVPLLLLTFIFQKDYTVDNHSLVGWEALLGIGLSILFIGGINLLWEKVKYIGSLEWMIGTIGASLLGGLKGKQAGVKWYHWGARDPKQFFYDIDWITIYDIEDTGGVEYRDSKLALKMSFLGIFLVIPTLIAVRMLKNSKEPDNDYKKKAKFILIIALVMNIAVIVLLSFTTMNTFGISL